MASQVPYYGTQEITPQVDPLSTVHVDTPVAAFGGAVAGAITHMGEVAQGAGKELFDRAYAMQDLAEHNKADMASTEYSGKATELYLQLDTLKGQDRADAIPKFKQDLETARQDTMAKYGVKSPVAIQQYNDYTRRIFTGMDWHASVLARTGLDEATQSAALSGMQAEVDRFSRITPTDPVELFAAAKRINAKAGIYAHEVKQLQPGTQGFNDEVNQTSSKYVSQMLLAASRADAGTGIKMLKSAWDTGLLSQKDYDDLKPRIEENDVLHQAKIIGFNNASEADKGASTKDIIDKTKADVAKKFPGDDDTAKLARGAAVEAANSRVGLAQTAELHANLDLYTTLLNGINGSTTNGKIPLTTPEALQDPKWAAGYANLPGPDKTKMDEVIRKQAVAEPDGWVHNLAGDADFRELQRIGKYPDMATPAELNKLLSHKWLDDQMTQEQRGIINGLQAQVLKDHTKPTHVSQLLRIGEVQQVMMDNGISRDNKDQYNHFLTEFGEAVRSWEEGSHTVITNRDGKELGEIAQKLIYRMPKEHMLSFQNPPMFELLADKEALRAKIAAQIKEAYGRDPTDDDVALVKAAMLREAFETLGAKRLPAGNGVTVRPQ